MNQHHDDHNSTPIPTPNEPSICIPKMDMSLHWGTCEWILVRTWKADTTGKFVFAAFLILISAFFYEGLKHYREVLYIQYKKSKETVTKQSDGTSIRTLPKLSYKEQLFNIPHGVQTFLHCLQVFISYILMLVVMLCNMYLIICVCVGAAIGYFTFGWMKRNACNDLNECCY